MAAESILESVKLRLRVSHNRLDSDYLDMIEAAKAEMERVSIDKAKASETDNPLIREAIKIFCQMETTTDMAKYDRLKESWDYRLDVLRKSEGYRRSG